jgi:hypothetical protein
MEARLGLLEGLLARVAALEARVEALELADADGAWIADALVEVERIVHRGRCQ